ncbi:cytochrome c biogenesis protein [Anthocerotibacter panamensis]|uniref:cytochrome c biogenesis protein n=1 Tax=Anthocerotibacter panamensis TaxID=2857077 RepID=UPI001C4044F2|nr:cytochrome c biogenesis protein [Anthocerotibacter panamensis]
MSAEPIPPTSFSLWQLLRHEILSWLGSLKLAIVLFLAIAAASISGTVINQNQPAEFYLQNYPATGKVVLGFVTGPLILATGLNEVYRSWWFLTLLMLLAANLLTCTFLRQVPMVKASRRWKVYTEPRQLSKFRLHTVLPSTDSELLVRHLKALRYTVHQQGDALYATKGTWGRVGPVVVHVSLLLILGGAVVGAVAGYRADRMIPAGQSFGLQQITHARLSLARPPEWTVRVNRFWIDYRSDGSVNQFYSDLSIVDPQGKERARKTISVNDPLTYEGVTFYQASWAVAGAVLQIDNSPPLTLPFQSLGTVDREQAWGQALPFAKGGDLVLQIATKGLQGNVMLLPFSRQTKEPLREGITRTRAGEKVTVLGRRVAVQKLIGASGLQIKCDPGVPLVYTGFGLLMLGLFLSYSSHAQVWAICRGGQTHLAGRTNRAQLNFERELAGLVIQLTQPTRMVVSIPSQAGVTP